MHSLFEQTKNAAYQIIERKGYTNTAIGVVIARILRAILEDESNVLPISINASGSYDIHDVCLSLPCAIGIDGVEGRILPDISNQEQERLHRSAAILKNQIKKLNID